jgi:hypothetical protein
VQNSVLLGCGEGRCACSSDDGDSDLSCLLLVSLLPYLGIKKEGPQPPMRMSRLLNKVRTSRAPATAPINKVVK